MQKIIFNQHIQINQFYLTLYKNDFMNVVINGVTRYAISGSLEGITKLINEFYCTNSITVVNGEIFNSKGLIQSMEVIERGRGQRKKYIFQNKP